MPTKTRYETVKQQVLSFEAIKDCYGVRCDIAVKDKEEHPVILIVCKNKLYHFSDPDWDVVIRQLATLWRNNK